MVSPYSMKFLKEYFAGTYFIHSFMFIFLRYLVLLKGDQCDFNIFVTFCSASKKVGYWRRLPLLSYNVKTQHPSYIPKNIIQAMATRITMPHFHKPIIEKFEPTSIYT